ncbi:MAG: Crossover junction endonuclease mus81, partial [Paramarteilia canceri]
SIGKSILVEVDYMELLMSGFLYLIKESSNINSNLVQVYLRLNDIKDHFTNTKLDHSKTSTPSILLSSKKTPLSLKRSFSEFDYFKADVGDNRIAKNLSVDFNNDSHGKNSSSIMLNDQTIAEIKAQISLEIDPNFSLYSVCPAEKLQKPQHENEFYSKLIHEGFHPSVIEANTFEIILIVDNSEPEYSANSLKQMGIKAERQKLNVGDFIWVARTNDSEHSK